MRVPGLSFFYRQESVQLPLVTTRGELCRAIQRLVPELERINGAISGQAGDHRGVEVDLCLTPFHTPKTDLLSTNPEACRQLADFFRGLGVRVPDIPLALPPLQPWREDFLSYRARQPNNYWSFSGRDPFVLGVAIAAASPSPEGIWNIRREQEVTFMDMGAAVAFDLSLLAEGQELASPGTISNREKVRIIDTMMQLRLA